jgi:DNA polymerase
MPLHAVSLQAGADLSGFRDAVRRLIATATPPDQVLWHTGETPALFGCAPAAVAPAVVIPVPSAG